MQSIRPPDKFNMVDMEGIDLLAVQGETIPGLYNKLVESIALCRYQCVYNWSFNSILIPPTYVEMEEREDGVWINEGVMVDEEDVVHIASIEPEPPLPVIESLSVEENGTYLVPEGVDGFNPVSVQVPVVPLPVIESLSITENGTYTAPEGVDGFNPISVQVPAETVRNYTNAIVPESEEQITDVSGFTKIFSTSVPFGSHGTKVDARLSVTNESSIASLQSGGWNANGMAFYDSENQTGAYGGYNFGEQLFITKVKLWLGRYSGQNANLNVSVEYLDQSDTWNDIESLVVATNLSYPSNVFIVNINRNIKGIRWIHKNPPIKTGGNNITFAGMSVYRGTGELIPCYIPVSGLNSIPNGYSGFGPVFIP